MAGKPLVSILVNCYNSEAYLKQALDSIYSQTYQNFEILLVDNCSTDKTAEIAKSYDQRLKYLRTDKTIPLYGARNVGLKSVTGEYLAFLDSDDWWVEDKLQRQISLFEKTDADFLYSSYKNEIEVSNPFKRIIYLTYLKLLAFSNTRIVSGFVNKDELIKKYNINLQTVILKTSLIQNINFDDSLSLMGDLDFFFRIFWTKNAKIYFESRITAISRIHSKQLSRKSSANWVAESDSVLKKYKSFFSENEVLRFKWYFSRFYHSQVLLESGQKAEAIKIKRSYFFSGISYALHFLKSLVGK